MGGRGGVGGRGGGGVGVGGGLWRGGPMSIALSGALHRESCSGKLVCVCVSARVSVAVCNDNGATR